jgi:hypothetical protein
MAAKTKDPAPADVTPDFLAKLKELQLDYDYAAGDYQTAKKKAAKRKKVMEERAEALFDFIRGTDGAAPLFEREDDEE